MGWSQGRCPGIKLPEKGGSMEKEEKVVIVLLLMALSSLSVAYFCFGLEFAGKVSGGEFKQYSPESEVGERVNLEAEVLSKRFTYTGGHLLLKVDYNSEPLTVFVPSNAGVEALDESINKGDFVSITGIVTEYEGEREIKVTDKAEIFRIDR
jgi:DNA/RNA endonuclease YhcR with UshA esterase domain